MPSISDILQTGLSSLLTSRDAISVAGDNIANANTPGFHRRSAELRALPGTVDRRGSFGLGVEIAEVRRVRNQYIEAQALRAVQAQGGAEASRSSLAEVEALFNDLDGGGLSQALNRFFNSFGDLANNPSGTAERSSVVAAGEELGGTLARLASELRVVRASIDDRARILVGDVNRITAQIAKLNGDIRKQEIGGGEASGLRDERELLLRELGGKISFTSFEDPETGHLSVMLGGLPLVSGVSSQGIEAVTNAGAGLADFFVTDGAGQRLDVAAQISGGALAGLLRTRDEVIVGLQDDLDALAFGLAQQVNAVHGAGRGLDGSQNDFFAAIGAVQGAAESLRVNAAVEADPAKVAAGLTAAAGDNEGALALAALRSAKFLGGGTQTAEQFYGNIVAGVGVASRSAQLDYRFQDNILTQLDGEIQATSGVSLDEEAANLLRFQQSFQAASRLIAVSDDMLKTVIGLV